jgi:hypothetical protein
VIEPRIYRAAFLPALLALVLVAFSLESPPRALDQGLAADALFEGEAAIKIVQSIVADAPDRRAGSKGDSLIAARVAGLFRSNGFATTVDRFDDDGHPLVNVLGTRAGNSSKKIVIVAARDSDTPPDATGSAADTAALMQFARVFQGRALRRTLVLASVDGGQLGDAGARRLAERIGPPGDVDAVIVISDLGAQRSRGPLVITWSNATTRSGLGLQRTVNGSLREELGATPGQEGTIPQFVRLAFPIAPGGQATMLEHGYDSVRVGGAGEVSPGGGALSEVKVLRYGSLGRSVLRMIGTLDASPREPERGQTSYVGLGGMIVPSWALELLALTLVLPALVTSIDALARARRRREAVAPWALWLAAAAVPFVLSLVVGWLLVLMGIVPDAPPAPLDPRAVSLHGPAIAALVLTSLTVALAWLLLRTRVIRRTAGPLPDATAPGAACVTSLALSFVALPMTLINPFAALMLVPALHLWMLATLTEVRRATSVVLWLTGLVPVLFVATYYLFRFELSPLRGAYYMLLLVTGGQTGLLTTVTLIVLLAITGCVATIVLARVRKGNEPRARRGGPPEDPRPSVFGPGGHAGPGMLGGTGSGAARR